MKAKKLTGTPKKLTGSHIVRNGHEVEGGSGADKEDQNIVNEGDDSEEAKSDDEEDDDNMESTRSRASLNSINKKKAKRARSLGMFKKKDSQSESTPPPLEAQGSRLNSRSQWGKVKKRVTEVPSTVSPLPMLSELQGTTGSIQVE